MTEQVKVRVTAIQMPFSDVANAPNAIINAVVDLLLRTESQPIGTARWPFECWRNIQLPRMNDFRARYLVLVSQQPRRYAWVEASSISEAERDGGGIVIAMREAPVRRF